MITRYEEGKTFTHIFHLADIHIRLTKRHEEYREIFEKVYQELDKTPEDTLVALLGDVCHSKVDLSPECVKLASDFFSELSKRRPMVLIPGNHDCNLNNRNRLDSLSPIVEALNNAKIFYLRENGLYSVGNILFNNMSVFNSPDEYIRGKNIPDIYRREADHVIALYHGPVDQAYTDTGYRISKPDVLPPLFDNHDMALLGDIHVKQDMQDYDPKNDKPCIHYVGSLIQQNHGEALKGHGITVWDLKERSYEFKEIENDYGYFTIELHQGILKADISEIPKKVRLRIKSYESVQTQIKQIISEIKKKVEVVESTTLRMKSDDAKLKDDPLTGIKLGNLSNTEYQCELIREFLDKKFELKDATKIEAILDINRDCSSQIEIDKFTHSIKWRPLRFEWSNMFSYGEDNFIDFTNPHGVVGIFAPNTSGKSAILSAMSFCLFDKFDRAYKAMHVMNVDKNIFKCKFVFEIDGTEYTIYREGHRNEETKNVKVNVYFWKKVDGQNIDLNGEMRRATNDVIRDYLGTYTDFILTVLSVQTGKNNVSFIDMGNTDRKNLLTNFIGLSVFDRLHEVGWARYKELKVLLKAHKDKNYNNDLFLAETSLEQAERKMEAEEKTFESLKKQRDEIGDEILKETKKLIKLDIEVPTSLAEIKSQETATIKMIEGKQDKIKQLEKDSKELDRLLGICQKDIDDMEISNLKDAHEKFLAISKERYDLKSKMDVKKVEIKHKLDKLAKLKEHKYDPNCKFCVENVFVKDARKTEKELKSDKKETDEMMVKSEELEAELKKVEWAGSAYQKYVELLNARSIYKDKKTAVTHDIIKLTGDIEKREADLKLLHRKIDLYHQNEIAVSNNSKIHEDIEALQVTLDKMHDRLDEQTLVLRALSGQISVFKSNIETANNNIQTLKKQEIEHELYEFYVKSVGRDGIPYQVICSTIPEIEKEVNDILTQISGFTLRIETDKNSISPHVVYEDREWPIEIASGFERFAASIAIRVALSNISNLPKTNFLIIDEGFGTVDPDNIPSFSSLFEYLKNHYDTVFVVSHLDSMRDMVDKLLEIKKDGKFSNVNFS